MNCSKRCSGHCINNEPCDHVSGVCSSGCQDGFDGTHCNHCKIFLQPFKNVLVYRLSLHRQSLIQIQVLFLTSRGC